MSTEGGSAPRVRASDAEREACAEAVRDAMVQGRLTLQEGEDRLVEVYATRFREDLPALLADLPQPIAAAPAAAPVSAERPAAPVGVPSGRRLRVAFTVCWIAAVVTAVSAASAGGDAVGPVFAVIIALAVLRRIGYRRLAAERDRWISC